MDLSEFDRELIVFNLKLLLRLSKVFVITMIAILVLMICATISESVEMIHLPIMIMIQIIQIMTVTTIYYWFCMLLYADMRSIWRGQLYTPSLLRQFA